MKARTAQANQIRGLLTEFGLVLPQGITNVLRRVPQLIDGAADLPASMRQLIEQLLENMKVLDRQVEAQIKAWPQGSELSRKLEKIPGIGPLAASALVASMRRHPNIAGVALANKNARTIWALLAHEREFRPDYVPRPTTA